MSGFLKIFGAICLSAIVLVALVAGGALWWAQGIPREDLIARYGADNSRFMEIDGTSVHYRIDGAGPAVVLVHGHFGNLRMWDGWVEALADSYRVIRFDLPGHGLTGPDATHNYTTERSVALIEDFVRGLGLERFTLGGTSIGGQIAFHYAAAHPERIERMVLANPGGLVRPERNAWAMLPPQPWMPDALAAKAFLSPRSFYRGLLTRNFGDDSKVTPELVSEYRDLMWMEGQRLAEWRRLAQYYAGDPATALARITAPTLIAWGNANPQLDAGQAETFRDLMVNADVEILLWEGLGHMPTLEDPARTGADVRAWLDSTPIRSARADVDVIE